MKTARLFLGPWSGTSEFTTLLSINKREPVLTRYLSDHPNARPHKRQPEETGSFGKSRLRRSSSRRSRTDTPAKRENPTLDGFEAAMRHDLDKVAAANQAAKKSNIRAPGDGVSNIHRRHSLAKEPTEVMLYGFAPSTQWAAVSFYETASKGIICEDYAREAPVEHRRIPNGFNTARVIHPRSLTKQEVFHARQYQGGKGWIKVTFDSAEAASRALCESPHLIQGHWVYAELFNGSGPQRPDESTSLQEDDLLQDSLDTAKPAPRAAQTIGPSLAQPRITQPRAAATLPRSFTSTSSITEGDSSTATSATATGSLYPEIRARIAPSSPPSLDRDDHAANTPARPGHFSHFPDVPRTALRPAHEAHLPHPSWMTSTIRSLASAGWLPGDVIGRGVPLTETGDFDRARASCYWKFFYWLDTHFWSDFCGLKES